MVAVHIKVTGLDVVQRKLGSIVTAAARLNGPIISLSSNLPYAYGIETGRHRRGRLARAAGGAFMFREGINAVRPRIGPALAKSVLGGPAAVDRAKSDLNRQAVEEVRRRTPVRSGALRASVRPSGRPV
jgi:hypothetical protein